MNIYVGNLPFSMTEDQLRDMFSEFGAPTSVKIITDRDTGRPRGFGFVEMSDEDAQAAISGLNEQEVGGRKIIVNEAKPRPQGGGGGGRGPRRR